MISSRFTYLVQFCILAVLLIGVLGYFNALSYRQTRSAIVDQSQTDALVLANRFEATLRRIAAGTRFIASHMGPDALNASTPHQAAKNLRDTLQDFGRNFPEVEGFFVVNADGLLRLSSEPGVHGIHIGDRQYFNQLRDSTDLTLQFSEVVKSRITGQPVLIAYHAILGGDGEFLGAVVVPIDLGGIARLFSALDFGQLGLASIRRADDSRLVVRWPDVPAEVNQPAEATLPYQQIKSGKMHGITQNPGKVDGVERIFAFRRVGDFPFYVLVGRSVEEQFRPWAMTVLISSGFGIAVLAVLGVMLFRLHRSSNALREREAIMSAIVTQAGDAIELTDIATLRFVEFNDAACRMLGYSRAEYAQLSVLDINAEMPEPELRQVTSQLLVGQTLQFDTRHRHKDGNLIDVQVNLRCIELRGRRHVVAIWHDSSERKRRERMLSLRHLLADIVRYSDQDLLLRSALDVAEQLTQSQIGFLHFVDEDQETVSLQVWSTHTLTTMCFAEGKGAHYPVSQAGVWVDCIEQRKPVVHNDYAILPHRKGLPEGHAPVVRELTVPLIRGDKVLAVIGVGNKPGDYTATDTSLVAEILDMVFDFVERQRAEKKVAFMAYHDMLTELPNRSLLVEQLIQTVGQARRADTLLAVCHLNLDGFKPINDSFGYQVGDALLVALAQRLKTALRQGDLLARIGGDEFAVVLTGLRSTSECENGVERILTQVRESVDILGHRLQIAGTIGATLFPLDDSGPDALLRHAHEAMYQAKSSTKSGYRLYDPVQEQNLRERRRLREEFALALDEGQLLLYYQPKIELKSGRAYGAEALVRWQHPERGLLAPGQFLPQIENTPLEIQLGEWVTRTALTHLANWLGQGESLTVSINISPRHLQLREFVTNLEQMLAPLGRNVAESLELEVLEVASVNDTSGVSDVMSACKAMGVGFALDDFGTGYSSLTHFHNLPIDVVKIDQGFVRGILDKEEDRRIIEGVMRLAGVLHRPVVAEGVETIEIALMLLHTGCEFAQGYGIARPMPHAQLIPWLQSWRLGHSDWHRLSEIADLSVPHYDLNIAVFSHRRWLAAISDWLNKMPGATLPELETSRCSFNHWYNGIGKQRYGNHSSYAFIPPRHAHVHAIARDLIACAKAGDLKAVELLSNELATVSGEMLHLIETVVS